MTSRTSSPRRFFTVVGGTHTSEPPSFAMRELDAAEQVARIGRSQRAFSALCALYSGMVMVGLVRDYVVTGEGDFLGFSLIDRGRDGRETRKFMSLDYGRDGWAFRYDGKAAFNLRHKDIGTLVQQARLGIMDAEKRSLPEILAICGVRKQAAIGLVAD